MTYEIYRYIFSGSAILSGLMLVLAFTLYFKLKIPKTISDLSGKTRRKALREKQKPSTDDEESLSVIAARVTPSGRLTSEKNQPVSKATRPLTDEIAKQSLRTADIVPDEELSLFIKETAVFYENNVNRTEAAPVLSGQLSENLSVFEVEYDITFVHTGEIIT